MNIGPPGAAHRSLIVLLIFGGAQLPKLARSLGQAQKEFKDGLPPKRRPTTRTPDTKKNQAS